MNASGNIKRKNLGKGPGPWDIGRWRLLRLRLHRAFAPRLPVLLAFVILAVFILISIPYFLEDSTPRTVNGIVECSSGRAVQGIWVQPSGRVGGWADWTTREDPAIAHYTRDNVRGPYRIKVGCGSAFGEWEFEVASEMIIRSENHFVCTDGNISGGPGPCLSTDSSKND